SLDTGGPEYVTRPRRRGALGSDAPRDRPIAGEGRRARHRSRPAPLDMSFNAVSKPVKVLERAALVRRTLADQRGATSVISGTFRILRPCESGHYRLQPRNPLSRQFGKTS